MPTYEREPRFDRDWRRLTIAQRAAFRRSVRDFLRDVPSRHFRPGLRVKGVTSASGVFELTWAPDGRATFEYGDPVRAGDVHIIWRRIGTHDILDAP